MSTKIVVPLDGSPLALESLPLALKLTHLTGGQLGLLRVVPPVKENFLWNWSHEAPVRQKEAAGEYLEELVKSLSAGAENHLAAGQIYPVVVEGRSPGQAIAEEAHRQDAAYIVMTTHGRSGLSELFLGSTAIEVVRHTSLPVIFLRPDRHLTVPKEASGFTLKSYRKLTGPVVVALDGSNEAEIALKPALELATQLRLSVHLLRVVPPFVPVDELASWYEANVNLGSEYLAEHEFEHIKDMAAGYLDRVARRVELHNHSGLTVTRIGEPTEQIISYAAEVNASLITMATHGHGRLEQALLGTVAGRVLGHDGFPVMMVNINRTAEKTRPETHAKSLT